MITTIDDIPSDALHRSRWRALGTSIELLTTGDEVQHDQAEAYTRNYLEAADRAASRFRTDSELTVVDRAGGAWVSVSPLLLDITDACLAAARLTDGIVVPTLGAALSELGYDRDIELVRRRLSIKIDDAADGRITSRWDSVAADWRGIGIDRDRGMLRVPLGVRLDVGAVGKAFLADQLADHLGAMTGSEVLINLGGDLAVGCPGRRWSVDIDESTPERTMRPRSSVRLARGGLATSSTVVRTWPARGMQCHHILDPRTGLPVPAVWSFVSVYAADCVTANTAATAAMVLGRRGPEWLVDHGLAARLVDAAGGVVTVGGWPADLEPVDRP